MKREIYFAGGCFWGVEKFFALINGVLETEVGYANGKTENPSYEEVRQGETGHAETVRVVYDGAILPLDFLLEQFYSIIDPTSLNRQGEDVGTMYRTGIYYVDSEDKAVIEQSIARLQAQIDVAVVVEILPLSQFFTAETYHQSYLDKNPQGYCHVPLAAFQRAKTARPS